MDLGVQNPDCCVFICAFPTSVGHPGFIMCISQYYAAHLWTDSIICTLMTHNAKILCTQVHIALLSCIYTGILLACFPVSPVTCYPAH